MRKKIADDIHSDKIPITASIGLASWPDDGISHTDIIASADVTLYRAKRNGGNQSICASGPLTILPQESMLTDTEKSIDAKFAGIVRAFSELVDSRSNFTHNHSKKVMEYALALAKALKLNSDEMKKIEICALLHDVGKVGISSALLNKPDKLTQEEWQIIRNHPQAGADIVKNIPQLAAYTGAILHHHEWYNGNGYPVGLKGDAIPLEARILAIADAFATITSERSYSETMTHESAMEEIKRCSGTQFDPHLVEQFVTIFEKHLINTRKKTRR